MPRLVQYCVASFRVLLAMLVGPPWLMTMTGGKVPAGADWIIADALGAEAIDDYVWGLVQGPLRASLAKPEALAAGDVPATGELAEGLVMSGLAMQAHESSRPASGAEHQFSHLWEMEGHGLDWEPPLSHGNKVGVGTVASCAVYDVLASLEFTGRAPKSIAIVGMQPVSMSLGMELSPAVAAQVPQLVAMTLAELAALGIRAEARG